MRGKEKARSTWERAGNNRVRALLPGRSRGADGIKENDRKQGGALHERIIMHDGVFVNQGGSLGRPLDSAPARTVTSRTLSKTGSLSGSPPVSKAT